MVSLQLLLLFELLICVICTLQTGKTVATIFLTLSQMTADGRLTADDVLKAGITRELLHSGVGVSIRN